MRTSVILLLLFLIRGEGFAQGSPYSTRKIDPEILSVNEGLSQGLVNAIAQDRFGFMWFGTLDGLNRYDGYKFTVFRHERDDSSSISDNFISSIFSDSKNRLWIGTSNGGLNLFDYDKEVFVHFRYSKETKNSLSDDRVLSISEDKNGALWIATKNGLNKFLPDKKISFLNSGLSVFTKIPLDGVVKNAFQQYEESAANKAFTPVFFIDQHGVCFAKTAKEIFSIRPSATGADTISRFAGLFSDETNKKQLAIITSVTSMEQDKQHLLFELAQAGIAGIDPLNGRTRLRDVSDVRRFKSFADADAGEPTRWFISGFHLYQYQPSTQNALKVVASGKPNLVPTAHTVCLFTDRTGKIWAGTSGYGVLKISMKNERFHKVESASIYFMSPYTAKSVFVKEENHFYVVKNNSSFKNLPAWKKESQFIKTLRVDFEEQVIGSAKAANDGSIWFQANGFSKYDPVSGRNNSISNDRVNWSAAYVDHDNEFWYCNRNKLVHVQPRSEISESVTIPGIESLPDFYVETILKDAGNVIWLGTTNGLIKFDSARKQWTNYTSRFHDSSSLSSNFIFSICEDADPNYLWIGTNGGGLNRFDKSKESFKRYSLEHGLPNDVVYGILRDDQSDLWMSTNKGLSRLNTKTERFENFDVNDGLQGNEFNRHAYCKMADGTMFFGGVSGYNYFHPSDIIPENSNARVLLTQININGHALDFKKADFGLAKPCHLNGQIRLDFDNNAVAFDFSDMDFEGPNGDSYDYNLEGIDKEWISSTTNHSSVYSNLQPGKYTFRVRSEGSNAKPASYIIIITPPWYATWWFTTLMFFAIAVILYVLYRYKLNNEIRLFKDHQRIASDLHDEIGSTLSSLHIYSEVALTKIYDKPFEAEGYLRQISHNVEHSIESLDDIVWALKSKDDRFEDIGNRMRAAAVNIAEASGYNLDLYFDERLNLLRFKKDTRKNLFLIYKEAINNVMKYANGRNLSIHLSVREATILLSVADDGTGFDTGSGMAGNGLTNMKKRAMDLKGHLEIISVPGKGTKVLLRFPDAL